jgi:hypothetical protein
MIYIFLQIFVFLYFSRYCRKVSGSNPDEVIEFLLIYLIVLVEIWPCGWLSL